MIALHTAIAIVLVIGLIIRFKVDPVISLIIASIYLGLASGVGFAKTVEAITGGFGEIMAKVGLLIGFGVLIGSLLHAMGTFRKLVEALLRIFGSSRIPYAMAGAMSTIFPSIYVDVQVVLASPIARSAAPHLGARGLPLMAGAIGTGIFAGYVFMVPGLAAVSIAGLLDIPLGTWLMYGIVLGPLVALVTTFLFSLLLRTGYWKPEKDEEYDEAVAELEAQDDVADAEYMARMPRLWVALLPIVIPLLLIAVNAFAKLKGDPPAVMTFLGNPTIALFIGLVGAYLLGRAKLGQEGAANALSEGFHTTGEILLITGIGGSLGAVIEASGLGDQLGGLFSADEGAPVVLSVLLAWFIAALLHLAIGSVSVAAIAAAGIIAPVLHTIDVSPIAIGLAIAAGSLFALQVNSNFFWMFRSLLGLSTSGTLKSLTVVTSIASFVALPIVMALAFVL
ncbi:MAG: GntP family permease [Micrococcales bacterium]|nr:GntP family permease [Micrococcales bacterium]